VTAIGANTKRSYWLSFQQITERFVERVKISANNVKVTIIASIGLFLN
jgi:hypothetical protein